MSAVQDNGGIGLRLVLYDCTAPSSEIAWYFSGTL